MCSSRDLFRQTVFHKCAKDINCPLGWGLNVKNFRNPNQKELDFGVFFHQVSMRQPIGRQDSMQTKTSKGLEAWSGSEL
jgi:hypothetical protein